MRRSRHTLHAPLAFVACPAAAALRDLGGKWTMTILFDAWFWRLDRFSEFLRANPGLPKRTLVARLEKLEQLGILAKSGRAKGTRYRLTPQARDALEVVRALATYGMKRFPDEVLGVGARGDIIALHPDSNAVTARSAARVKATLTRSAARRGRPRARNARPTR